MAASSPSCQMPNDSPRSALRSTAGITGESTPGSAQQGGHGGVVETAEATSPVAARQGGDLELGDRELPVGAAQRLRPQLDGGGQIETVGESVAEAVADRLGVATEHRKILLIHDRAVVHDVEHLVAERLRADFGHEDLDLHRLHLVREDVAED